MPSRILPVLCALLALAILAPAGAAAVATKDPAGAAAPTAAQPPAGDTPTPTTRAPTPTSTAPAKGPGGSVVLTRRVTLDFTDTPWPDVLKFFAEGTARTTVIIDADAGDLASQKVSLRAHDISIASALKLLCGETLAWKVEGGAVHINNRAKVLEKLTSAEYRVADLVVTSTATMTSEFSAILRGAVNNRTDLDVAPWSGEGGSAAMQSTAASFTIAQTPVGQEKIAQFLAQIRNVIATGKNPAMASVTSTAGQGMRLRKKLDADFEKTPLRDILKYINDSLPAANLVFDPEVASEDGKLPLRPTDLKLQQTDAATLLKQAIAPDLTYVETPEYILVTTPKKSMRNFVTLIYPVGTLISHHPKGNYDLKKKEDLDRYKKDKIDLEKSGADQILSSVQTGVSGDPMAGVAAWVSDGGLAYVGMYRELLVVTQTPRGHEKVLGVLADMAKKGPVGTTK
jgi:hypothetical protein